MSEKLPHTDASRSLSGYKAWRKSLVPLPVGTILRWDSQYDGVTLGSRITVGQYFKITKHNSGGTRPFRSVGEQCAADTGYDMIQCTKTGKLYKRSIGWSVENIARFLVHGQVSIVTNASNPNP